MSDFDKEAERERLREKYEREEEKREVTERMSELLLKGATMTNAHCQECGDPIFRYDGQEFCATCQRTIQRDTDEDAADTNGEDEEIEVAEPGDTRVQFGGDQPADADEPAPEAETAEATASGEEPTTAEPDPQPTTDSDSRPPGEPDPEPTTDTAPRGPAERAPGTAVDGELAEAGASLVRSVTELAQRAETTDDLGRKRDLLAATREAAAALSAVRDAGR